MRADLISDRGLYAEVAGDPCCTREFSCHPISMLASGFNREIRVLGARAVCSRVVGWKQDEDGEDERFLSRSQRDGNPAFPLQQRGTPALASAHLLELQISC